MGKHTRQAGFTLVEILIVVVILGILAAIVIPQFTQASESAKASSLVQQLQTIRSQLELYQIQHNGNYPDLNATDGWEQMTESTDAEGQVSGDDFGPYLQQPPNNPFTNTSQVATTTESPIVTAGGADDAWMYNPDTGEIKANLPTSVDGDDLGLNEEDYVGGA